MEPRPSDPRALPLAHAPSEEELAHERAALEALEQRSFLPRTLGYLRRSGPGFLQSAMTLGGGTASATIFAGAAFGYELLWVAPLAMLLGTLVLAALAHQTLSTGLRPFEAMRRYAGAPLAWAWALGALASSIVWHFPHYALSTAALADLSEAAGLARPSTGLSVAIVLAITVLVTNLYGASVRTVRVYETVVKAMVAGIVVCFAVVVARTGVRDWGALARGFVPHLPASRGEVAATTLVASGLAAAVGVNMLFLYPYTLLARGWGRAHRRLARYDLGLGTLLPYAVVASLVVVAAANTLHLEGFTGTRLQPVEAAARMEPYVGASGRLVFLAGVFGMALSSMTLHMLCAGFVGVELFGLRPGGLGHRLMMLTPAVGAVGAWAWSEVAFWAAVPTNVVCGLLLPAAYIGIARLANSREYLGEDRLRGPLGTLWRAAIAAIALFLLGYFGWYVVTNGPAWLDGLRARLVSS